MKKIASVFGSALGNDARVDSGKLKFNKPSFKLEEEVVLLTQTNEDGSTDGKKMGVIKSIFPDQDKYEVEVDGRTIVFKKSELEKIVKKTEVSSPQPPIFPEGVANGDYVVIQSNGAQSWAGYDGSPGRIVGVKASKCLVRLSSTINFYANGNQTHVPKGSVLRVPAKRLRKFEQSDFDPSRQIKFNVPLVVRDPDGKVAYETRTLPVLDPGLYEEPIASKYVTELLSNPDDKKNLSTIIRKVMTQVKRDVAKTPRYQEAVSRSPSQRMEVVSLDNLFENVLKALTSFPLGESCKERFRAGDLQEKFLTPMLKSLGIKTDPDCSMKLVYHATVLPANAVEVFECAVPESCIYDIVVKAIQVALDMEKFSSETSSISHALNVIDFAADGSSVDMRSEIPALAFPNFMRSNVDTIKREFGVGENPRWKILSKEIKFNGQNHAKHVKAIRGMVGRGASKLPIETLEGFAVQDILLNRGNLDSILESTYRYLCVLEVKLEKDPTNTDGSRNLSQATIDAMKLFSSVSKLVPKTKSQLDRFNYILRAMNEIASKDKFVKTCTDQYPAALFETPCAVDSTGKVLNQAEMESKFEASKQMPRAERKSAQAFLHISYSNGKSRVGPERLSRESSESRSDIDDYKNTLLTVRYALYSRRTKAEELERNKDASMTLLNACFSNQSQGQFYGWDLLRISMEYQCYIAETYIKGSVHTLLSLSRSIKSFLAGAELEKTREDKSPNDVEKRLATALFFNKLSELGKQGLTIE